MAAPKPRRPAVLHDVARLAGVSHMTVSRVMNGSPNVREETRARVLRAIEQLDYRPNQIARGLVTRRSGRIGVISLESRLFGPASSLLGIVQAAKDVGYVVTVAVVDAEAGSVQAAAEAMAEQAVEGVVVIAPSETAGASIRSLSPRFPVVAVEASYGGGVPIAAVDQYAGARLATEHLLALGHERIWHVAGPGGWSEAQDREAGWREALNDAGVAASAPLRGDWNPQSGYEAGCELARRGAATAVFVANDHMALGVINAFAEAGVRVPHDVSVVGFDDIPEAAFMVPRLTTVRQDFDEVGRLGVRMLTQLIDGERSGDEGWREAIAPRLVVRSSTAAPCGARAT